VKSVLWRQADEYGVIYTEDREHLRRLLAMEKFPLKREEDAATYKNARGRVFAWQVSFEMSLWNRVVRALGRSQIEVREEPEARAAGRRRPAAPTPAASAHPRERRPSPSSGQAGAKPASPAPTKNRKSVTAVPPTADGNLKKNPGRKAAPAPGQPAAQRKTDSPSKTAGEPISRASAVEAAPAAPRKRRGAAEQPSAVEPTRLRSGAPTASAAAPTPPKATARARGTQPPTTAKKAPAPHPRPACAGKEKPATPPPSIGAAAPSTAGRRRRATAADQPALSLVMPALPPRVRPPRPKAG